MDSKNILKYNPEKVANLQQSKNIHCCLHIFLDCHYLPSDYLHYLQSTERHVSGNAII